MERHGVLLAHWPLFLSISSILRQSQRCNAVVAHVDDECDVNDENNKLYIPPTVSPR